MRAFEKVIKKQLVTYFEENNLINDFEEPVFNAFPEIATIKEKLYNAGAAYASMTGTGSTVYGIFDTSPSLKDLFPSHYQLESIVC